MLSKLSLLALASSAYAGPGQGLWHGHEDSEGPSDYSTESSKLQWVHGHSWATGAISLTTPPAPTYSQSAAVTYGHNLSTTCTESGTYPSLHPPHYPGSTGASHPWPAAPHPSKPTPTKYPSWPNSTWHHPPPYDAISTTAVTKTWTVTSTYTTFRPISSPVYSNHGTTYYSTSLTVSYRTSTWLTSSTSSIAAPTPYLPPSSNDCPVCPMNSCAAPVTITHTVYAPMPTAPTHTNEDEGPAVPVPIWTETPTLPSHTPIAEPSTYIPPPHHDPPAETKPSVHPPLPPYPTKPAHPGPWRPTGTGKPSVYPTGSKPIWTHRPSSTSGSHPTTPVRVIDEKWQHASNGPHQYGRPHKPQGPPPSYAEPGSYGGW